MAEAIEISRQERPVNFRQQSTINPENLERNFRHADAEINKIYQILGNQGIINQASIQTVVLFSGGGGGGGGGGGVLTFINLTDTPSGYNVEGITPSIDGAKAGLEFSGLNVVKDNLPAVDSFIVDSGYQMQVADSFQIEGQLTVKGKLVVMGSQNYVEGNFTVRGDLNVLGN